MKISLKDKVINLMQKQNDVSLVDKVTENRLLLSKEKYYYPCSKDKKGLPHLS